MFIAVLVDGIAEIHATGLGTYSTLCGLDGDDEGYRTFSHQQVVDLPENPKITCPDCIEILKTAWQYSEQDIKKG